VKPNSPLPPPDPSRKQAQSNARRQHHGADDDTGGAQHPRVTGKGNSCCIVIRLLVLGGPPVRRCGQDDAHQDEQEAEGRQCQLTVGRNHDSGNHQTTLDLLHSESRYRGRTAQASCCRLVRSAFTGRVLRSTCPQAQLHPVVTPIQKQQLLAYLPVHNSAH